MNHTFSLCFYALLTVIIIFPANAQTIEWYKGEVPAGVVDGGYSDHPRFLVDINRDGYLDYGRIVGNPPKQLYLSFHLGAPNGGFQSDQYKFNSMQDVDPGYLDKRIWLEDANRDGRLDYCRYVGDAPNVFVGCVLNDGDGFNGEKYYRWKSSTYCDKPVASRNFPIPTDAELIALRDRIRAWATAYRCDEMTPTKNPGECSQPGGGAGVGDSVLFSALLNYSGETWAGKSIEKSMDEAGGMWRSPQRLRERRNGFGGDRFSMDHALGTLLYIATENNKGFKNSAYAARRNNAISFAHKWSTWIDKRPSGGLPLSVFPVFSICPWDISNGMDYCAVEGSIAGFNFNDRGGMIREVFAYMKVKIPKRGNRITGEVYLGKGGSAKGYLNSLGSLCSDSIFGGSFHCHLQSVAQLILQEIGHEDLKINLHPRLKGNPFALWVNNGRKANDDIRSLTYDLCKCAAEARDGKQFDPGEMQWSWERFPFQPNKGNGKPTHFSSMGWDCITMINLIVDPWIPYHEPRPGPPEVDRHRPARMPR